MSRTRIGITLLVVVATVLVGCAGAGQPSSAAGTPPTASRPVAPSPAASVELPVASASPSVAIAPTPSPTLRTRGFAPDSLVEVVTNDLRMRSEPGVRSGSRLLTPLLQAGTIAVVLDGPVAASGYAWYRIHPIDPRGRLPEVGWVAASSKDDGERWVDIHIARCSALPDHLLEPRRDEHALACFGDRELSFEARLGADETGPCFEVTFAWRTEPGWFDPCGKSLFLVDVATPRTDEAWSAPMYSPAFAPSVGPVELGPEGYLPQNWVTVSVTGQFDHPEARTCRAVPNPDPDAPAPAPDADLVVLYCRSTFVVTSLERTGDS